MESTASMHGSMSHAAPLMLSWWSMVVPSWLHMECTAPSLLSLQPMFSWVVVCYQPAAIGAVATWTTTELCWRSSSPCKPTSPHCFPDGQGATELPCVQIHGEFRELGMFPGTTWAAWEQQKPKKVRFELSTPEMATAWPWAGWTML